MIGDHQRSDSGIEGRGDVDDRYGRIRGEESQPGVDVLSTRPFVT